MGNGQANQEWGLWEPCREPQRQHPHTVHSEPGFLRVGGAKVVGDDTLVAALMPKTDTTEVQDGGVLHHLSILRTDVGEVLHVSIGQNLVVLLPSKGHRGAAAAGC